MNKIIVYLGFLAAVKVKVFWEGHKNLKKMSHYFLMVLSNFEERQKIFSNLVAFLEYLNFIYHA